MLPWTWDSKQKAEVILKTCEVNLKQAWTSDFHWHNGMKELILFWINSYFTISLETRSMCFQCGLFKNPPTQKSHYYINGFDHEWCFRTKQAFCSLVRPRANKPLRYCYPPPPPAHMGMHGHRTVSVRRAYMTLAQISGVLTTELYFLLILHVLSGLLGLCFTFSHSGTWAEEGGLITLKFTATGGGTPGMKNCPLAF